MYHIVYTSTAVVPISEAQLEEFLVRWRANNQRDGITGILLYSQGRFMQVIEGEEENLRALFGKIEQDYRHRGLLKLADGPISARNFRTWLMGFQVLTPEAFAQLAGYVEPCSATFEQALAKTQDVIIQHLLRLFAEQPADSPN